MLVTVLNIRIKEDIYSNLLIFEISNLYICLLLSRIFHQFNSTLFLGRFSLWLQMRRNGCVVNIWCWCIIALNHHFNTLWDFYLHRVNCELQLILIVVFVDKLFSRTPSWKLLGHSVKISEGVVGSLFSALRRSSHIDVYLRWLLIWSVIWNTTSWTQGLVLTWVLLPVRGISILIIHEI